MEERIMLNELKRWELQLFADDGENVGGSDAIGFSML
jgi:hypothetical protein